MDEKRGIGKDGGLPWRLSSDLKRFRELTMGHHIVVGRKTFESIGRPLPGREMIVVTRNESFAPEGCFIARSVEDAIQFAKERGESELFICGGAEIYAQTLDRADRIYLTLVHADCGADTFFPAYNGDQWVERESEHHAADEKNQHAFTFKLLVKKAS
nr:Dihydrofolate reductase [uncultured bacterium]